MSITLHLPFSNRLNEDNLKLWDSVNGWNEPVSNTTLAHTRSSVATVLDNDKVMRDLDNNVPIVDGARYVKNLLTYSEDFSATWVANNATIGSTPITAPDGATTALKIEEKTDVSVAHNIEYAITGANVQTVSMYAKADEREWLQFFLTTSSNFKVFFHLSGSGSIGTTSGTYYESGSAKITSVGNGWYRCEAGIKVFPATLNIGFKMSTGDDVLAHNGVAGNGMYMWGAQLEDVSGQSNVSAGEYQLSVATQGVAIYACAVDGTAINPKGLDASGGTGELCSYNQDVGGTGWTASGGVVTTPDATTGPDAHMTGGSVAGGTGYSLYAKSVTITANKFHCLSLWFKQKDSSCRYIQFSFRDDNAPGNAFQAWADIKDGVITKTVVEGSCTLLDYGVIPGYDGWNRFWIAGKLEAGITAGEIVFIPRTSGTGTTNATNADWYMGPAGLTQTPYPAAHIRREDATAASLGEANPVAGTDLGFLNDDRNIGSWYFDFYGSRRLNTLNSSDDIGLFSTYQNSVNIAQSLAIPNGDNDLKTWSAAGVTSLRTVGNDLVSNTQYKLGNGWELNNVDGYLNGVQGSQMPDSSYNYTGTAITSVRIGRPFNASARAWDGHIAEVAYDDTRVTDLQLKNWSNGLNLPFSSSVVDIVYPRDSLPTTEQRFQDFIDDSGITRVGHLDTDYRRALISVQGLSDDIDYDLPDAFKRYFDSL